MILTHPETPGDYEAIREVNRLAFNGEDEAYLVDRLRADGLAITSLVAVEDTGAKDKRVVGHILFSDLPIETGTGTIRAAALAPMAVAPARQCQGIGSALVREGLKACRSAGIEAVVVLGHPDYYPRFGFSAKTAEALRAPFSGPAFMALELTPGALTRGGTVHYPAAFGLKQT